MDPVAEAVRVHSIKHLSVFDAQLLGLPLFLPPEPQQSENHTEDEKDSDDNAHDGLGIELDAGRIRCRILGVTRRRVGRCGREGDWKVGLPSFRYVDKLLVYLLAVVVETVEKLCSEVSGERRNFMLYVIRLTFSANVTIASVENALLAEFRVMFERIAGLAYAVEVAHETQRLTLWLCRHALLWNLVDVSERAEVRV